MFSVAPWDTFQWRNDLVRVEDLHATDEGLLVEVVRKDSYDSPRWRAVVPIGQFIREATPFSMYGDDKESSQEAELVSYFAVPESKMEAVLAVLNA